MVLMKLLPSRGHDSISQRPASFSLDTAKYCFLSESLPFTQRKEVPVLNIKQGELPQKKGILMLGL